MDAIGLLGLSAITNPNAYSLIKTEYLDLTRETEKSLNNPAGAVVCMASCSLATTAGHITMYWATCRGSSIRATRDNDKSMFIMSWDNSAVIIEPKDISIVLLVNIYWFE